MFENISKIIIVSYGAVRLSKILSSNYIPQSCWPSGVNIEGCKNQLKSHICFAVLYSILWTLLLNITSVTVCLLRNKHVEKKIYLKNRAKPVNMVNLACRPLVVIAHTLKKPASFCDIINGNYSITWPTVQLETWPQVRTYFYVLMRKLDLTTLADLNESIFFVSYCTWAAVFIH